MPELIRRRVLVSGTVQGVFFRQSTHRLATRLGLTGWVSNLPDGRVEAVFQGEPDVVHEAVTWCHQGPEWAEVESVEVREEAVVPSEGFGIR